MAGGKGRFQGKVQAVSKRGDAFAELQRLCGGGSGVEGSSSSGGGVEGDGGEAGGGE